MIAGFENHGGRTYLGASESPLGRVLNGHGNNDRDGFEGVHSGNVIGTYLHGPLLPKNVWLADRLIELALGIELEPLPHDELEAALAALTGAPSALVLSSGYAANLAVLTTLADAGTLIVSDEHAHASQCRHMRGRSDRGAAFLRVRRSDRVFGT